MQHRTVDHTDATNQSAPAFLNLLTLHRMAQYTWTLANHTVSESPLFWLMPAASQHCFSDSSSESVP